MAGIEEGYLVGWFEDVVRDINVSNPQVAEFMLTNSTFSQYSDLLDPKRYYKHATIMGNAKFPQLADLEKRLNEDKRLQELCTQMAKHRGRKVEDLNPWCRITPQNVARELLRDYIYEARNDRFDKLLAEQMEQNLIWCLTGGHTTVAFQSIFPYLNCPSVQIESGLSLGPGPDTKVQQVYTYGVPHEKPPFSILTKHTELPIIDATHASVHSTEVLEDVENVVISLRLLKQGLFFWEATRSVQAGPGFIGGPLLELRCYDSVPQFAIGKYELLEDDLDELSRVLNYVRAAKTRDKFDVSLRRFSEGVIRKSSADSLLDYCIAMENLFRWSDRATSYSLQMRCAAFVEDSLAPRKETRDRVRKAWIDRNKLVHEGKVGDIDQSAGDLESYLRKAHLKLANELETTGRVRTREKFIRDLDNALLGVSYGGKG